MSQLSSLSATTELDAVNEMLGAIGQTPLDADADLDTLATSNTDVQLAVQILRSFLRALCAKAWRFNTEFGYEIAPSDTFAWEGTDASTATLNIFLPPAKLMAFKVSNAPSQQGLRFPDVILKRAREYTVTTGTPPDEVVTIPVVFYDREKNRDGLDSVDFDFLYIDPVWMVDFVDLPETAKKYVLTQAARKFILNQVGSSTLYRESEVEELKALRDLEDDQGIEDTYNLLQNAALANAAMRGRSYIAGVYDPRASPGPA